METIWKQSEPVSRPPKRGWEGRMPIDPFLDRLMGVVGYVSSAALAWMTLSNVETLAAIAAALFTAAYHAVKTGGYVWDRYKRWRDDEYEEVAA